MKKIFCSIGIVVINLAIFKVTGSFIRQNVIDSFVSNFLGEMILGFLALISIILLKKKSVLKFKFRGITEGLSVGAVFLIISGLGIISFVFNHEAITASSKDIIFFVIDMFLVGFSEEVLFRGIIQNEIQEYIGCDSVKSVRKTIIVSGITFGMIHMSNVFSGVAIIPSLIQAVWAIPVGILFGVIYYRSSKNLWVCIFIHAINDLVAFLDKGILSGCSQQGAVNSYSAVVLFSVILYVGIVAFVMRKEKIEAILNTENKL